jgi:hypothetical protein
MIGQRYDEDRWIRGLGVAQQHIQRFQRQVGFARALRDMDERKAKSVEADALSLRAQYRWALHDCQSFCENVFKSLQLP